MGRYAENAAMKSAARRPSDVGITCGSSRRQWQAG
jgi:hypothetical protein